MLQIERIIVLKSIEIFSQIPDDVLAGLALITEEESFPEGIELIHEGDVGDCMYIIQSGSIRIHQGDSVLATIKGGDIFGEMTVLNPMPRTASATTLEETFLLKIYREPFLELMAQEPEVIKSILKVLTLRIVHQNALLSQKESLLKQIF